jgi:NAD(P)H dehydrogenase (quinone)
VITIFGAGGKVGGTAVQEIRRRGFSVRAVVRDPGKAKSLAELGCEIAMADLRDVKAVKTALEGAASALVICPMKPRDPDPLIEPYRTIDAITEAIEEVEPGSIVAISDYGAHHPTGSGIALIFHRLEQRLASTRVPTTFLRSCEQMQNWARFIKSVTAKGVLPIFHQPFTRLLPLVSAPDVGSIAAEIMTRSERFDRSSPFHGRAGARPDRTEVIHVEGPQRYSPNDVVAAFQTLTGNPVVGRKVPSAEWAPNLISGGLSEEYAELVAGMYAAHNAGLIEAEPGGEIRRGTTPLIKALAALFA